MKKQRVKTGERRKVRQPFHIDRLPPAVHQEILRLRNEKNTSWEQIEALSAEKPENGGFVKWDELPRGTLELFPDLRIPSSNLQRWFDVRVEQIQEDVMRQARQAHVIAEQFAKANLLNSDQAVVNAARDLIMGMLGENTSLGARTYAIKALIALNETLQKTRTNNLRERQVTVEERRITQLEKIAEQKLAIIERETAKVAKKIGPITIDDINRIRERSFGLPPLPKVADAKK
jgi:hypothetical protein